MMKKKVNPPMKRPIHPMLIAATACLALAACATKSKTGPMATTSLETTLPPSEGASGSARPSDLAAGVRPGSQEDLAATVGDRVYFALDSDELSDEARVILDRQAGWFARYPTAIMIAGNADERGTREYNLALGARRANAVRQYLISRGAMSSRLGTISYGKERPLDPRSTEEGWAVNRNAQSVVGGVGLP